MRRDAKAIQASRCGSRGGMSGLRVCAAGEGLSNPKSTSEEPAGFHAVESSMRATGAFFAPVFSYQSLRMYIYDSGMSFRAGLSALLLLPHLGHVRSDTLSAPNLCEFVILSHPKPRSIVTCA